MRLIDADVLCEKFQNLAYDDWNQGTGTTWANAFLEAENIVEDAPTIDAVQVVRCKDCKYARMTYAGECKYCDIWFPDEAVYIAGDSFCSAAERKEE